MQSTLTPLHSFFVDAVNPATWEVFQALDLPCQASAGDINGLPQVILHNVASWHCPALPVHPTLTIRELALHPDVIAQMSRGMINHHFLNNAKDADEILAHVKKAQDQLAKLNTYEPVDGISGPCPLGSNYEGDYAQWIEEQAWPFMVAPDEPGFERRFDEKVQELAVGLFAWEISLWARSVDWKPNPPHEFWLNQNGKLRRLFHFRTPRDKIVLNTLSLVLQASFAWPNSAHGWIVGRGVHTAAAEITNFIQQGFVWVQALDIRDAFATVNRVKVKKRLRGRFDSACKNLKPKSPNKLDIVKRTAECWEFIKRTIDIDKAVSHKGGLIDVNEVGLLQGSSVAPIYFNLMMEPLDLKFCWFDGALVVYIRFADNIFLLAKTRDALKKGVAQVRSYCGQFGCKLRCETEPANIYSEGVRIEFLGLVITITKHGTPTATLSRKAVSRFAERIAAMPSHRKRRRGLRALFRHYAPGGYLPDDVLQYLAERLTAALRRKDANAKMDIRYCNEFNLMALRDDILKSLKMSSLMYDEDWNPDDEMYLMS